MIEEKTNKEKILLVLKESLKFARETNFIYDSMYEKHRELTIINNLGKTIKEKIELFVNINEDSHLFATIYDCAKLAHTNMVNKKYYNYYSAELIMKFLCLEDVFKRKLKPVRIHINADVPKVEKQKTEIIGNTEEEIIDNENFNEEDIFEPLIKSAEFLEQGLTGKEFVEKKNKKKELISALKSTSFE